VKRTGADSAESLARETFTQGIESLRRGAVEEAAALFAECVRLAPEAAEGHLNLAVAHRLSGRYDRALIACRRALELLPRWPDAHFNLGDIALAAGDLGLAVSAFEEALVLRPEWAEAFNSLGVAHVAAGRIERAIHAYNRAIELAPEWSRPYSNRAIAVHLLGEDERAIEDLRHAIQCEPAFAEAHGNLSLLLLRQGRFREAWPGLDWHDRAIGVMPTRPQPLWSGQRHTTGPLLMTARCGFGDILQFVRFAPFLRRQFGGPVNIECPLAIKDLVSTCAGVDGVVLPDESSDAECQYPLMSGPARLGEDEIHLPATQFPYIYPPVVAHAAANLIEGCSEPVRVGFVWRVNMIRSPRRACPLAEFLPLASVGGVQLFSLQFDETAEERAFCEQAGISSIGPSLGDFTQTAAIVLRLDLVITVDTSMAHLAGALGVPVWVLLPENADWRWMLDRSDSPWYPTMRLFRSKPGRPGEPGDAWSATVDSARTALIRFAGLPRATRPLRKRRLHTLQIKDIPLLVYDERDSWAVDRIVKEFAQDAYGLDDIDFRPGDVVIDIGAHVGLVSLYLAKRYPHVRIHAFEPHPLNYENCVDNLRLNDVANVRPFRRAVSGDGRALMLRGLSRNTGGASAAFEMTGSVASGPVDSMTLDDLFDEVLAPGERCRLLKIDCEGLEYEILPRASALDRVDYLVAEFHEAASGLNDVRATALTGSARELADFCRTRIPPERVRIVRCEKFD
jgi:FkbM family methyltransferase